MDHGPAPAAPSAAASTAYVVMIVCDGRLGQALSRRFPMAVRENWAPFEAWRCMDAGRGVFILSIGPHPTAVDAGVALAMAKFPAAPVIVLTPALVCDPDLDGNRWFVCDPISPIACRTLFLMAPLTGEEGAARRTLRGDKDLVAAACARLAAPVAPCGSCEGPVDFEAQARWLHQRLGVGLCDQRAFSAACRLADGERRWVIVAYADGGPGGGALGLDGVLDLAATAHPTGTA